MKKKRDFYDKMCYNFDDKNKGGFFVKVNLEAAGQRIRQIRKQHKYSMATMAKLVGTSSASTVNNWEKGNNLPNKERLEKIAILGNTTVEWLMYGDFEGYVYQLLKDVIEPEKLAHAEFMDMLLLILKREHISYTDDLQILTIAKKLYVAPAIDPADRYPEAMVAEPVLLLEDTPLYKIENNSIYRQELLPQLEHLLSTHTFSEVHASILLTVMELLKQPYMGSEEKEQLLALLEYLATFEHAQADDHKKRIATATSLFKQFIHLLSANIEDQE